MSQLHRYLWGSNKTPVDDIQTITKVDSMGLEQTPQHVETILTSYSPNQNQLSNAASTSSASAESSLDQDQATSTLILDASLALPSNDNDNDDRSNKKKTINNRIMRQWRMEMRIILMAMPM
jgi:hypothetical protein